MSGFSHLVILLSLFRGYLGADSECSYSRTVYFIPNPVNCQSYFECIQGQKFLSTCPDGLFWNQVAQYCDFRENVLCDNSPTRSICTSATDTENLPYPFDCNKFYHCDQGKDTLLECPENMYFNPKTSLCDFMDQVECTATPTSPLTSTTFTAGTTTTDTPISLFTTDNPATQDPICPSVTETIDIYYPYDCNKYYHCVNGQKELLCCPENMYFNPKTEVCDFMDDVECDISTTTISTKSPPLTKSTPGISTTLSTITTDSPATQDPICPSATGVIDIYYPNDCNKYYHCVNGQKQILSCPENMYFNPETKVCDFMDNVACDISTTTLSTISTESSPTTKSTPSISTSATSSPTTQDPDSICEGLPEGAMIADPDNCRNFYDCAGGKAILFHCANGSIWDQTIKSCIVSDTDC